MVRQWGEARARPLLLVADLPGSTQGLDPVAAQLARERRVVAIDPPGQGLSSPAPAGTADGGVALVARAVASLGLGQVDVAGINVGACWAAHLAACLGADCGRLVLIDPPPDPAALAECLPATALVPTWSGSPPAHRLAPRARIPALQALVRAHGCHPDAGRDRPRRGAPAPALRRYGRRGRGIPRGIASGQQGAVARPAHAAGGKGRGRDRRGHAGRGGASGACRASPRPRSPVPCPTRGATRARSWQRRSQSERQPRGAPRRSGGRGERHRRRGGARLLRPRHRGPGPAPGAPRRAPAERGRDRRLRRRDHGVRAMRSPCAAAGIPTRAVTDPRGPARSSST